MPSYLQKIGSKLHICSPTDDAFWDAVSPQETTSVVKATDDRMVSERLYRDISRENPELELLTP